MTFAIVAGLIAIAGFAAWWRFLYSRKPAPPALSAPLSAAKLITTSGERSFHAFVPARREKGAALLLVLHGSNGDAAQMRRYTGYEFERLADAHGFVVVYPEGFGGYWNDVRKKGSFAAKKLGVDDVGFLRALVQKYRDDYGVRPVFAVGYSNGGQMCFRLALEAPDLIDGIAVAGANMPTDDNCVCPPPTRPISALFVNGTRDPISPYDGGRVTIFGFGDRGTVRSAGASAEYFAQFLGAGVERGEPKVVVAAVPGRATWVDRRSWSASSGQQVALLTVHGGGHVVPQPYYRFPRILGHTEMRLSAPAECWSFFSSVVARQR